ncbi:hypothetical protein BZA05DRAFT_126446 [Tricharina praecox]|uniref:uncharacterized protein n=1 Tax=Tricharina praecox TaxID=43433 RepID=UPI00221E44F8|nr:uncharacterized protein BZA05DRAFT_126446 [Tricharina praecox]KAI5847578.1 hypothetical protein BZA05DRAFT_126446 [Tricharina praecox]
MTHHVVDICVCISASAPSAIPFPPSSHRFPSVARAGSWLWPRTRQAGRQACSPPGTRHLQGAGSATRVAAISETRPSTYMNTYSTYSTYIHTCIFATYTSTLPYLPGEHVRHDSPAASFLCSSSILHPPSLACIVVILPTATASLASCIVSSYQPYIQQKSPRSPRSARRPPVRLPVSPSICPSLCLCAPVSRLHRMVVVVVAS